MGAFFDNQPLSSYCCKQIFVGGKVNFDDEDPNMDYDGSDKEEDSGNEGDGLMEFSDFVNAKGLIPISEKQNDDDDTEGDDDDTEGDTMMQLSSLCSD